MSQILLQMLLLCSVIISSLALAGDASCPCIDPGLYQRQYATLGGAASNCLFFVEDIQKHIYCYPVTYGVGQCQAWDSGLPPFCNGSNVPDFCGDPWCFVDPNNCQLDFLKVDRFVEVAYISYSTCAAQDRMTSYIAQEALQGMTIRIGFPSFEVPYLFNVTGDAAKISNVDGVPIGGAMVDLVLDVLKDAGINYTVNPITSQSKKLYKSTYTACVHSVGIGALDLCIGAFWETAERHALSAMGNTIFSDYMVLLSKTVEQKDTFLDLATRVFNPFTWSLWLLSIGITFLFGLLIWWNEISNPLNENPSVKHSIYLSISFFCPAGEGYQPSAGGRVLVIAMGIFVVIISATYTANLASFLVAENAAVIQLTTLKSVIATSSKLCLISSLEKSITHLEPLMAGRIYISQNTASLVQDLNAGNCDAALMTQTHADEAVRGDFGYCDMVSANVPIMVVSNALPMSRILIPAFGYQQQKLLETKPWPEYLKQYEKPTACSQQQASVSDNTPVGIEQMTGLWLVLAAMLLFWLCHTISRLLIPRKLGRFGFLNRIDEWEQELRVKKMNREKKLKGESVGSCLLDGQSYQMEIFSSSSSPVISPTSRDGVKPTEKLLDVPVPLLHQVPPPYNHPPVTPLQTMGSAASSSPVYY